MIKYLSAVLCLLCISIGWGAENDWWRIYFTQPEKNIAGRRDSDPENALAALIDRTTVSIDGAFFDIGSQKIASAFIRAQKRGVKVRLVTDNRNLRKKELKMVKEAGIPVVNDRRTALMHDKFAVLDSSLVWTGSYNITSNCSYRNNNNAIAIRSAALSAIYQAEFNEMFEDNVFGNRKEKRALAGAYNPYYVKIDDTHINVYFSPDNDVEDIILKRIRKAKKSIIFMAFSFTSDPIGEAMIESYKKGIAVEGLFEKRGSDTGESEYKKMVVEGIPVRVDKNKYNMHHKVIVIDEQIVITGSYNFSRNASRKNDENIIILENSEIAKKYIAEFHKLY